MTTDETPPCANCQRLQAEGDALRAQLLALRATVEQLQRQLAAARKDSSNSSRPPSSDIVKPPQPTPPPGQEIIAKVSRALERPHEELLADLPEQSRLNLRR